MNEPINRQEAERKREEARQREEELRRKQNEQHRAAEDKTTNERGSKTDNQTPQRQQLHHKPDQVELDYRYVMNNLQSYLERTEREAKESPSMERYKAHEKDVSGKVQEYLKADQSRAQGQEKTPEHTR